MKSSTVIHVKVSGAVYKKLKRQAKSQMRSIHSLALYAVAKFVNGPEDPPFTSTSSQTLYGTGRSVSGKVKK